MSDLPNSVSCLLLPVQNRFLLLPNTSVAEIVDYQAPEQSESDTPWFLGFIRWRGLRLPLISYEGASGKESSFRPEQARIAVTNCIGSHAGQQPFIAFLTSGLPRLAKVAPADIQTSDSTECSKADEMAVTLGEQEAFIPDLSYLEDLAWQAHSEY